MSIALASHNDDIRRLLERGYALRVDGEHLVVLDVPYLSADRALKWGGFAMKLVYVDQEHVRPNNHEIFFAGGHPCGLDGSPIRNLGGGERTLALNKKDQVIQRSFSNKPAQTFTNFYDIVEHYITVIAGPAMELHGATPLTRRVDTDVIGESVFKVHDTLTSRAEIGDLAALVKDDVIAIIGLGGTGAYVLDLMVKTPVKEIRGFDGDHYLVHNAFRSPGRLNLEELNLPKAAVHQSRFETFRYGLSLHAKYVHSESARDLQGVTFAFVCVDKGSARAQIFDLLISMGIPFIDVGMGLDRKLGPLSGTIRTTYYSTQDAVRMRDMMLAEMADDPDDIYESNVQIAELNSLNACFAVIRYKQIRGFYLDGNRGYNSLINLETLRVFTDSAA